MTDITVDLSIENIYPDEVITTTVSDQVVDAPDEEAFTSDELLDEWAAETLLEFTGTGRTHGDSSYDITVTASSEPRLVGTRFELG